MNRINVIKPVKTKTSGASFVKVPILRLGISSSRNSFLKMIAGGLCSLYNVYRPLVRIYWFVRSLYLRFGISEFQSVNEWKNPPIIAVFLLIFIKSTIYLDCASREFGSL